MSSEPVVELPVLCKYLGIPLTRVFGIVYGSGESSKLVGPFFSLGVAIRFYQGEKEAGRLSVTKYGQYLLNIAEQLGLHDRPQYKPFFWFVDVKVDPPVEKRVPKSEIVKQPTKLAALEEMLKPFLPPKVIELETYGGGLTRLDYQKADPSFNIDNLTFWTSSQYLQSKRDEQERRRKNRNENKQRHYSVYAIGYAKNKTDMEEVVRIDINNPYFQDFITKKEGKTLHTKTQKFKNGCRTIWSSGQNINQRATRLLYPGLPKEEKEKERIKGMCFVMCVGSADLKLQGFLPVNKQWKPVLDKGDGKDDKDSIEIGVNHEEEESDSDSDSEIDTDEEDSDVEIRPKALKKVSVEPPKVTNVVDISAAIADYQPIKVVVNAPKAAPKTTPTNLSAEPKASPKTKAKQPTHNAGEPNSQPSKKRKTSSA